MCIVLVGGYAPQQQQNDFHFNVRQQSVRERESEKKMYKNTISNRH